VLNTTGAAAALDFQNGLDLNGATRTIRVDADTATISGLISNSLGGSHAGIVKIGSGVLRLTQANTFESSVTISGGAIAIGNNGALGAADVILSGGSLQADGAARTLANNLLVTATSGLGGSQTLSLTGVISGAGVLNKSGTSVVQLSGVNTHSGATNVSDGLLRLLTNTALGATSGATTASGNGTVELASGVVITGETITVSSTFGHAGSDGSPTGSRGALQAGVNATAEWAGNVIIGGNLARIGVQEGGTLILSGDITDGVNSFLLRLSGELTGTGGVILKGTNNTWDGGTDVVRGTITLGAHNTLPTTTTLDIHFTSTNNSEYAGVNMNGFNQTIGSLRNGGSTGANAEITNKSRVLSTLTVNETGTATYGGIITGNLALVKNGAGTMILTQSNRHTGGTTVNEGILRITSSGALAGGNVTVNGGATAGGLLDLNNLSPTINSLNGAAGTVSAIIANDSTINALRTLTVGVNHGSGSFAGNIVDNTGGLALGRVALTKIGAGTQTLSGTNTFTGDTLINNGTLIANFATGTALNSTSAIKMQGGTLIISNATTATIGNLSLTQVNADFTSGTLKIENGAIITTGTFTGAGFVPFLIDLSGGGTLVANALSVAAVTNGVLTQGGSNRSTIYVRDSGGIGFATRNGSNQIVRYTAATTLTASNTSATGVVNYIVGADLTRTTGLGFHTLQIDTAGGDVTLNMGSGDMTVGNTGRGVLISGTNDATITGSGVITGGSVFFANYSTGTATIDISLSGQAVISAGTGLTTYTKTANMADLYVAGGVFRMEGADRDFNTGTLRIYGGGVLEIGADLNGAADGAFTRGVAQSAGNVSIIGNGGFSAHGADRVVALGGTASPAALTWGASDFLTGPGGDNNYTFMLGSASSTHTLEFRNAINLGTRDRRIEVADGTSATNVDARLTGVLSGTGASIIKEGTGRLEFTAANTYTGRTEVNAGSLVIASTGRTGTGEVTVAANAALMGTGTVQGSSFTLAANASLHAGKGGTTADIGTLTFQTSAQAVYNLQTGSAVFLDIQNANNHGSIDPTFGGNAVGSAGYNAFVDAFAGVGAGTHDLLVFDATAGSTLTFSSSITVRPGGFTGEMGQVFNLLDWTSLVSANFSGFDVGTNYRTGAADNLLQFDLPELTGGLIWDISRFTTSGVIVVVPEPGRALLVLLGLWPLLWRRRRH
jgi:autotransporter-associated beta strand protein